MYSLKLLNMGYINRLNSAILLCLSQARTNVICHDLIYVLLVEARCFCLFCWYWWCFWPSLFKLSFPSNTFVCINFEVYKWRFLSLFCVQLFEMRDGCWDYFFFLGVGVGGGGQIYYIGIIVGHHYLNFLFIIHAFVL